MKVKNNRASATRGCTVCGKPFPKALLIPAASVRQPIGDMIRLDHPGWSENGYICRKDLAHYRTAYVESVLETEKGELSTLEQEVIESLEQHELLSANIESEYERELRFGERLADLDAQLLLQLCQSDGGVLHADARLRDVGAGQVAVEDRQIEGDRRPECADA